MKRLNATWFVVKSRSWSVWLDSEKAKLRLSRDLVESFSFPFLEWRKAFCICSLQEKYIILCWLVYAYMSYVFHWHYDGSQKVSLLIIPFSVFCLTFPMLLPCFLPHFSGNKKKSGIGWWKKQPKSEVKSVFCVSDDDGNLDAESVFFWERQRYAIERDENNVAV